MAATLKELQELHRMVAKSLTERIEQDLEDKLPTDAATLGAAIKFLKDNNVSADPADSEDLTGLREQLTKQMQQRKQRGSAAIAGAKQDITLN
jgi:Sec-independent protein translocase protein TatA